MLCRSYKKWSTYTLPLNIYFSLTNQINLDNYIVKIYSSVTLENRSIIHATDDFYRKAWYSNVAVAMNSDELFEYLSDQEICYRQVYFVFFIKIF